MIDSSQDVTLVLHMQDEYDVTSFITKSLMTFPLPSVQRGLSVAKHRIFALSATDASSVISGMPETKIELNCHSLVSLTLQPTIPAIVHSVLSVPFLPQEKRRQQSAVSLISVGKDWILPKSSVTFVFPSKATTLEKVDCFSSSVMQESKRQISLPNEYLDISLSSFSEGITELCAQSAGSLSKLNQTCTRGSTADIKFSSDSSDGLLHNKESLLYDASWMNSTMLTSCHTLMESTTITSGHSFVSASETALSVKFTKVSSWYPAEKGRDNSSLEEYVPTIPLQRLNSGFLCVYSDCTATVLSQTFHLEPSFSAIIASQRGNSYVTSKLTRVDQLTAVHILPVLDNSPYDQIKEILSLMSQEDSVFIFQSSYAPEEENDSHIASHSDESTSHMLISSEERLDLHLRHAGITHTGSVGDFLDRPPLSEFSFDMTSGSVLFDQLLPTQTHSAKIPVLQYLLSPDEKRAASTEDSALQQQLSTHGTSEELTTNPDSPIPQSHSVSTLASRVIPYHFAMSGELFLPFKLLFSRYFDAT
ncbi:hypothetical protein JD844_024008 [Phrynosoma platyrhinos]|uniref:Uncharacterized protein n=1 Tax=Phrynosoma platyrhinos TaxID=52577 RepID=A0ABQ7SY62_PHRPL|nr:hypothetical protein JD844_024008 [Phrynosoma platyrhinos]